MQFDTRRNLLKSIGLIGASVAASSAAASTHQPEDDIEEVELEGRERRRFIRHLLSTRQFRVSHGYLKSEGFHYNGERLTPVYRSKENGGEGVRMLVWYEDYGGREAVLNLYDGTTTEGVIARLFTLEQSTLQEHRKVTPDTVGSTGPDSIVVYSRDQCTNCDVSTSIHTEIVDYDESGVEKTNIGGCGNFAYRDHSFVEVTTKFTQRATDAGKAVVSKAICSLIGLGGLGVGGILCTAAAGAIMSQIKVGQLEYTFAIKDFDNNKWYGSQPMMKLYKAQGLDVDPIPNNPAKNMYAIKGVPGTHASSIVN